MNKIYEFHWKGCSRFGERLQGIQLAEKREQVEQRLLAKGIEPLSVRRNFRLTSRPKNEVFTQILYQLLLLLNATIPLKQSLFILLENSQNIMLYRWLSNVIKSLENGFSFSAALEQDRAYLNSQEIQLIKMGEKSGRLNIVLNGLVDRRVKQEKLSKKIQKVLLYPLMVLSLSVSVSILLLIFIVPKFAELYQFKENSLPSITNFLFVFSSFLQESFEFVIVGIVFLCVIFLFLKKRKVGLGLKYSVLGKLPLFGGIIKQERLVFFCQYAGLMLHSHVRLDSVLMSFANERKSDLALSQAMTNALDRLKQGYRLHESLNPHIFPHDVLSMLSIGEKSGELATMLFHIGDMYQRKLDARIDLLSQLLEPLLMLVMGIIVGTILIGLYMPIFDMGAVIE